VSIILVGLNHRTAPIELREQLALSTNQLHVALDSIRSFAHTPTKLQPTEVTIHEAIILSTCNRLEIYARVQGAAQGQRAVLAFLARLQGFTPDELQAHLYCMQDDDVIQHLMRVASGLDSMILGEPQILGQVTNAYGKAQAAGTSGPILSQLFSRAIHAGKRAHSETDISRHTTSVSHAAAQLVIEQLGTLADHNILIMGAGEMAVLAAKAMRWQGAKQLTFINRTDTRAEKLAEEFEGIALSWYQLQDALIWADVVISATGAPHPVLYARDVQRICHRRGQRPLIVMDIALPRDVEEAVGELARVQRYDIDDLQVTVDENRAQRAEALPQVEAIIQQELAIFLEWLHSRQVVPVITHLRQWAKSIAEAEVAQALNRLDDDNCRTQAVINRLAHRIVNKILHEPTVQLRQQAAQGNGYGYAHAVRELFALQAQMQPECAGQHPQCDYDNSKANGSAPAAHCHLNCIVPKEHRQAASLKG